MSHGVQLSVWEWNVKEIGYVGCRDSGGPSGGAVAETAVCCVNELLSKNQVPTGACEQFVLALFVHMFSLVKAVTSHNTAAGTDSSDQIIVMLRFDQLTHRSWSTSVLVLVWIVLWFKVADMKFCGFLIPFHLYAALSVNSFMLSYRTRFKSFGFRHCHFRSLSLSLSLSFSLSLCMCWLATAISDPYCQTPCLWLSASLHMLSICLQDRHR